MDEEIFASLFGFLIGIAAAMFLQLVFTVLFTAF